MDLTADAVLDQLTRHPQTISDLGAALARAHGVELGGDPGQPIGQRLGAAGLSLSALQRLVDQLVGEGRAVEARGRELWDLGLPTEGTKAMGRYYLSLPG